MDTILRQSGRVGSHDNLSMVTEREKEYTCKSNTLHTVITFQVIQVLTGLLKSLTSQIYTVEPCVMRRAVHMVWVWLCGCGYLGIGSQLVREGGADGETKNGFVVGHLLWLGLGSTV